MHATTSELIARRDGEPLAAETAAHIDSCTKCRQALGRIEALRDALRELPQEQPPAAAWECIVAARELESPARTRPGWQRSLPFALVASLLAAVFSVLLATRIEPPLPVVATGSDRPVNGVAGSVTATATLAALQDRSGYLEQMLDVVQRGSGGMTSLQTADTVAELQDGIALIDYRLSQADRFSLSEAERQELWQRRVELLESLLTVRYAQLRANSI